MIHVKTQIALIHKEKKAFECDVCDYGFQLKSWIKIFKKSIAFNLAETFHTSEKYKEIPAEKVSARLETFNF